MRNVEPTNPGEPHGPFATSGTQGTAKNIVAKAMEDRRRGLPVTDGHILDAHPELAKELKLELNLADQIRQARLAATRFQTHSQRLPPSSASSTNELEQKQVATDRSWRGDDESAPMISGYLIAGEISRGGQAVVYHGIQESTGRTVAIKVMSGGPFAGSRHRIRFEREAKILAAMDHPNIVGIIERGRTPDGSFFFVMQFIDGVALDEYWTNAIPKNPSGLRKLVQLFATIANAVEEAHSNGVVHRDLKPSNVRVDRRGEPHVLDFGLASPVEGATDFSAKTITTSGQIIGSLPWASPEQADGRSKELGPASDVYSLGVILYQALTASLPYSTDGPIDQVLLRIRTTKAGAPSKHPSSGFRVDKTLDCIVLKALEKSPTSRYPSAGLFARDLEAWLAGTPTLARRREKPGWKRWMLIIVIAIAISVPISVIRQRQTTVQLTTFQLPSIVNSIGMKLIKIPAGAFMIGSADLEEGHQPDEHSGPVDVPHSYYIGVTEVTQAQYETVMKSNPSDGRWRGPTFPVNNVSWTDARMFCKRLSELDHARYRLPSEIEYEYACRANNGDAFPVASNPWLTTFSIENSGGAIHPVAQKLPNAWGLFDMQGNVQEWCEDYYFLDVLDQRLDRRPLFGHVVRAGSAFQSVLDCRAASRQPMDMDHRAPNLGFRVVREIDDEIKK